VKVIGQKHVGVNLHFVTTNDSFNSAKKRKQSFSSAKMRSRPFTSGAKMINRILKLHPQRSRHSILLLEIYRMLNVEGVLPKSLLAQKK
jgi:hypothetical protein